MKKNYRYHTQFLLSNLLILLLSSSYYVQSDNIKSVIISYNISGEYEEGEETLYLKGNNKKIHRKVIFNPPKTSLNLPKETLTLVNPNYVYEIDLISKTGTRTENPNKLLNSLPPTQRTELINQSYSQIQNAVQTSLVKKDDNPLEPTTKLIQYFGKKCKLYETSYFKVYEYKDLIFRHEIKKPIKLIKDIKSFKPNALIKDSEFELPLDVTINELSVSSIAALIKSFTDINENKKAPK